MEIPLSLSQPPVPLPASQSSSSLSSCSMTDSSRNNSSSSTNNNSNRQQLHVEDIEKAVSPLSPSSDRGATRDGDPFHRRNTVHEATSGESLLSQQLQVGDQMASQASIRSGNFPDQLLLDANALSRSKATAPGKQAPEPRLLHPILLKIPLHIRFGLNGVLSNVLFMVAYNYAVLMFEHKVPVSTIYSIVYFVFIPLGHAFVSLLVFGWPEKYIRSLMGNFPIGLTAIAIGGVFTGYLDRVHFSERVDEYIRDNLTFSKMPPRVSAETDDESQFWSSLLVLTVTSVWTYVLSIYVNSAPTKSEKKEL